MDKDGKLVSALNMTDYKKKIDTYNFEQLLVEKEKIATKLNVNYGYINIYPYYIEKKRLNIADSPDEKNRIYVRKKVAMATRIVNSKLDKFAEDFSSYWIDINNEFAKTTSNPDFISIKADGKAIPFPDKLNLKGLVAYKRYLLLISDQLDKVPFFNLAVKNAIEIEQKVDKDFDRDYFFTRFCLPKNIDAIYKNLIKEKVVNDRIKEIGKERKIDTSKEQNL